MLSECSISAQVANIFAMIIASSGLLERMSVSRNTSGSGTTLLIGCGMAKPDPKKEPELHPDAWARFERAVDVVAKSPPQHRTKKQKAKKRQKKKGSSK